MIFYLFVLFLIANERRNNMNKAYRFRLYPNDEQKILLAKTFGCVRFIYNKMLTDKIAYYEKTKQNLIITPAHYKKEYEWLKEVDSLALANAQMHLQAAYNNFFRNNKTGFPKFKSKKDNHYSYTTNKVNNNIKLTDGYLTLPKLKAIKIKQHRPIPNDHILRSVTVSKTPSGKYYASILYEYKENIKEIKPTRFIGLDFSMHELYVASDGSRADYPRYYRQALDKLALEQRRLSKMQKGSNNRNKQRVKVAKIYEKVVNQRKDFLHKQSRQIANVYDCVCIEDLNMQAMAKCLNFGKSVSDNGWGSFTTMLNYKLREQGKKLIKIDKFYSSSKTCSVCGAIKQELTLSDRTYVCSECGTIIDRDYNASINIKNEGMRLVLI